MNKSEEEPGLKETWGKDCLVLRPLWEEVFFEDSQEFTDYYFQEKAERNHGFALWNSQGQPVAMLYLAPYDLMLRVGKEWVTARINYIIGVATKKEYRHRGYMDRLLRVALEQMSTQNQPFTFLMPADPLIYQPYQFAYIYAKEKLILSRPVTEAERARTEELSELAEFASAFLSMNYDVFIRRDKDYFTVLEKELAAQNGGIGLWRSREGKGIEGYFLYTQESEKLQLQEAVVRNRDENWPVISTGVAEPVIMARVVDVQRLLSLLRTDGAEVLFIIRIVDPLLEQNQGLWECRISSTEAQIHKRGDGQERIEGSRSPVWSITAENLIPWIFGYKPTKECFCLDKETTSEVSEHFFNQLEKLTLLSKVFINEIV